MRGRAWSSNETPRSTSMMDRTLTPGKRWITSDAARTLGSMETTSSRMQPTVTSDGSAHHRAGGREDLASGKQPSVFEYEERIGKLPRKCSCNIHRSLRVRGHHQERFSGSKRLNHHQIVHHCYSHDHNATARLHLVLQRARFCREDPGIPRETGDLLVTLRPLLSSPASVQSMESRVRDTSPTVVAMLQERIPVVGGRMN